MEFTMNNQGILPIGATVKAYPKANWGPAAPGTAAPIGVATAETTVDASGNVTFTGVVAKAQYYAAAQVGGVWRYVAFTPVSKPSSASSLPSEGLGEVTGNTTLNAASAAAWTAKLKGATTFKLTNPPANPTKVYLLVEQDATGGRNWTIENVVWVGGEEPAFSTAAGKRYLVELLLENGEILASVGQEGKAGFNPNASQLPREIEVFKSSASAEVEKLPAIAQSIVGARNQSMSTEAVESGKPKGALIPVQPGMVISGFGIPVGAAETLPAKRTHFWGALQNHLGAVTRRTLDYVSSVNTPLATGALVGFKFTEPYVVPAGEEWVWLAVDDAVSEGTPLSIYKLSGTATLVKYAPVIAGTYPAGQTTPAEFKESPTLTGGSNQLLAFLF